MNRATLIRLLLTSPLLLGIAACSPCCTQDCPAIYLIDGDADDPHRYNVLFVGDGFADTDQLLSFQDAAQQLARGIHGIPPFEDLPGRINFYRMDVLDDGILIDSCDSDEEACFESSEECEDPVPCSSAPLFKSDGFEPAEQLVDGSGMLRRDLGLYLCSAGFGLCNSIGMPDSAWYDLAATVARNGPSIDAVVVLANAQTAGGGAGFRVGGETTLAILGVPLEGEDNAWTVSPEARSLFAHELAHTIGLYDEYGGSGDADYPTLEPGRNVWKPTPDSYATFALAQTLMPVPWRSRMNCENPVECVGQWDDVISECVPTNETDCIYYPYSDALSCRPDAACDEYAGLWEGAYHHNSGHYRSHQYCKMKLLGQPFCEACVLALKRLLCCFGAEPCAECPYSLE